jgi:hypothetical protein
VPPFDRGQLPLHRGLPPLEVDQELDQQGDPADEHGEHQRPRLRLVRQAGQQQCAAADPDGDDHLADYLCHRRLQGR